MGNLHSTSSTSSINGELFPPQKKRLLITPKKLRAKLRRQSVEQNSGALGIAQNQNQSQKSGDNNQTADTGECAMCSSPSSSYTYSLYTKQND